MYCNRNKIVASNVGILLADTIDIHAIQLSNNRGGSIIKLFNNRRLTSKRKELHLVYFIRNAFYTSLQIITE